MQHATHTSTLPRLRRIAGQVGGIIRMVEDERYCVDILTQLRAAQAALKKVENLVLSEHVEHCVQGAVRGGNAAERQRKIGELMDAFGRFGA